MSRRQFWTIGGALAVMLLVAPLAASAQGRFHGLDRNRDGVITRAEWRGNDTSFRQHDSNRDGIINGSEVSHVPAWDARNNRWERSVGTSGKAKSHQHAAKGKPSKPVKAKGAKPKKGKG